MRRYLRKTAKKPGSAPGTLVYLGERHLDRPRVEIIDYDLSGLRERSWDPATQGLPEKDAPTTTWVNLVGLHDPALIRKMGEIFGLHPLVLEDVLNLGQRSKVEDYGEYLFLVVKMPEYQEATGLQMEQVSLVLGPGFLITFQEKPGDLFDPVRKRLREGGKRIRKLHSDYLAYTLVDAIVDHYFIILERIGERIERLEERLLEEARPAVLQGIHQVKKDMVFLRKSVWPLRELIHTVTRGEFPLIRKGVLPYLRDVHDHTVHVADTVETYRDMLSGLMDLYLSTASNRMNEVMKVLTIMATIFIPLTFIAGVYGMNFKYMPELEYPWGYPVALAIMLGLGISMFAYFKIKDWL